MVQTRVPKITTQGATVTLQGRLSFIPPIQPEPSDTADKTSYLGTPIYSSLFFKALSGSDLNNLPNNVREIVSKGLELTEILMTVNQSKNIKRTPLNGRNGTVKEYISDGDYSITVQGMIVTQFANVHPKEEKKALTAFLELDQSLEIGSSFLSDFGVTNIVVNDFSFHELEGFRNQLAFRLLMWSDTEFKIEPTQNVAT